MAGYIKFDREIFEEPYLSKERYSRLLAFMDLCYMATYKPYSLTIRGISVSLQPMQLAKSADYLASRWMWNKRTVLCFLSTLQDLGYIALQKSRVVTVITIKKGICDALQIAPQTALQIAPQTALQNAPQTALQTALPNNKDNTGNNDNTRNINIPPISPQGASEEVVASLQEQVKMLQSKVDELEKKKRSTFTPPTQEELAEYIKEKNFHFEASDFIAHYESNGWMVGKNKMKDWKAACRTWERMREEKKYDPVHSYKGYTPQNESEEEYDVRKGFNFL